MALTLKQRLFCETYISNGGNGTDAYISAYDVSDESQRKTATSNAHILMLNAEISQTIESLRDDLAAEMGVGVAWRMENLKKNQELARECGQLAAANGAVAEINKMCGTHGKVKKKQRLNLVGKTVAEKIEILSNALANNDIELDEYTALINTLRIAETARNDERINTVETTAADIELRYQQQINSLKRQISDLQSLAKENTSNSGNVPRGTQ